MFASKLKHEQSYYYYQRLLIFNVTLDLLRRPLKKYCVLASSDGISSWTPLKPQHSIPCWLSVQWKPSACRSCQWCQKKGSSKVCGWICSVWLSWVWESQHASTGNSVSWSLGHSSRSSFHRMAFFPSFIQNWPIFMISGSNEQLQQQLEYTLLKPNCHCWWISKMQSDTLEERYAIKFFFKLGKNATETYGMLQTTFRPSCMNRASVFEWHKRFKEGTESVRDDERYGRSKEVNTPELIVQRVRVRVWVIMLGF